MKSDKNRKDLLIKLDKLVKAAIFSICSNHQLAQSNLMIHYDEIKPIGPLSAYVDSYVFVYGEKYLSKTVTPQTSPALVFDFRNSTLLKNERFKVALIGLYDREFCLESINPANDKLMVRFSPYGLTQLTGIPPEMIFNQIVAADEFFGREVNLLYEQLKHTGQKEQRVEWVEAFLLRKFKTPSASDMLIFELTQKIRQEPYLFSFADLKETTPLSPRQVERKFRALLGTNIQTYLRLARFEKAKSLLDGHQTMRLTDIGYESGYYDQAHFSSEFKKLAGVPPKSYVYC